MLALETASAFTFIEVFGQLAGVSAAIWAALLHCRTLAVLLAALYAGCREAAGLLWSRTVALLHPLHRLQELAACETLIVLFGKEWLEEMWRRKRKKHIRLAEESPTTSANRLVWEVERFVVLHHSSVPSTWSLFTSIRIFLKNYTVYAIIWII